VHSQEDEAVFKIAAKRLITWPVTVHVPQDGGTTRKASFDARLDVLTASEIEAALAEGKDLLEVQLVGWDKLAGEDGQPLEYSEELKKKLLDLNYVRQGLFNALTEINTGRAAARKN
jgi:hypothetical protein